MAAFGVRILSLGNIITVGAERELVEFNRLVLRASYDCEEDVGVESSLELLQSAIPGNGS